MNEPEPAEQVEGLGVVDAMTQTLPHRAHIIGLDRPNPTRALFGPAVTIGSLPVTEALVGKDLRVLLSQRSSEI